MDDKSMMTPEREKEIREYLKLSGGGGFIEELLAEIDRLRGENANMRLDLEWPIVKERDALRCEVRGYQAAIAAMKEYNERLKSENEKLKLDYHLLRDHQECHVFALKDEIQHQKQENQHLKDDILKVNYGERLLLLEQENQRLKERIGKLRECFEEFSLPPYLDSDLNSLLETLNARARLALAQDDEAAK